MKFGEELAQRMMDRCGGRQYMSTHVRRGDFFQSWQYSTVFETHVKRVRGAFADGLAWLQRGLDLDLQGRYLAGGSARESYSIPLPLLTDPYFLATDETDANILTWTRKHGGVLLSDLMTAEDEARLGPAAMISDWRGLVEQAVMSRSAFFFGSKLSSFTGGVMNQRVPLGKGWGSAGVA
jgi:hypothetical protein